MVRIDKIEIGDNVPSNLLDDAANESSALAQVTLGAGNTGLGDTSSGLLYLGKKSRVPVSNHGSFLRFSNNRSA